MRCNIVGIILTLACGILVVPLLSAAQPPVKVPRIGVLSRTFPFLGFEAFQQGLRELGWAEGQHIVLEVRTGERAQFPDLAAELVRLPVDVMVTFSTPAALAATSATKTIPIVMASVSNPVERGLVASLAHPGGNVTGVTHNPGPGFVGKQLEMLKEAAPQISRVGVFWDSTLVTEMGEIHTAAQALGMTVLSADVPDQEPGKFAPAFATLTQERADALYVFSIYREAHVKRLVDFANTNRLPTMFGDRRFVEAGGLMSYWTDRPNLGRRAAAYVDKILKGAKPGDLPVERPLRFELVINLKTAQALGLTIPPSVLFQADEVIR